MADPAGPEDRGVLNTTSEGVCVLFVPVTEGSRVEGALAAAGVSVYVKSAGGRGADGAASFVAVVKCDDPDELEAIMGGG